MQWLGRGTFSAPWRAIWRLFQHSCPWWLYNHNCTVLWQEAQPLSVLLCIEQLVQLCKQGAQGTRFFKSPSHCVRPPCMTSPSATGVPLASPDTALWINQLHLSHQQSGKAHSPAPPLFNNLLTQNLNPKKEVIWPKLRTWMGLKKYKNYNYK